MTLKTFASSFALLLIASLLPVGLRAQTPRLQADTVRVKPRPARVEGVQYHSPEEAAAALEAAKELPLFAGVSVGGDLCGAAMALLGKYGQYEAAARLNMRGRYFPIFEAGVGVSDHTNETTNNHFKVHAPYFRLGMDYNVMKNRRSGNRVFVGLRYAFSSFKYDVDGPALTDPVYGTTQPFAYEGLKGMNHWGEAVFGIEARVWGILHLGWSFRYRIRFSDKKSAIGSPWYVPGYGKNDTSALGGSFNLIFDI